MKEQVNLKPVVSKSLVKKDDHTNQKKNIKPLFLWNHILKTDLIVIIVM